MVWLIGKTARTRLIIGLIVVSSLIGMGPFQTLAYADPLIPRSLTVSDNVAATHNVTYQVTMGIPSLSTVGSVRIQICSNSALVDDGCTPPFGFDASAASLTNQTGAVGFTISNASTANELILTRPPTLQPPATAQFTFANITNPTNGGSFYGRLTTYASSDASGPYTDSGGLAFSMASAVGVSTEVPPFLEFCLGESITAFDCSSATEAFSDLGKMNANTTSAAQSQMVIATNADNGYSMWVNGASMTSGTNVITPMSGGTSQKGTSQFGLNLRANATPSVGQDPNGPGAGTVTASYNLPDHFRFNSGDVLATAPQPDDHRKYTVSYVVNIPPGQPGGVYSTTLVFICLANF